MHDLANRFDWLPDDSMDLVLFALALEYVDDRVTALSEPAEHERHPPQQPTV